MIFILSILLLSFAEYFGDSQFKAYARSGNNHNLIYGIIFYALVIKLLVESLKKANLIYTNGMWDGVSAILATILAYYFLHETLSNPMQWAGLIMIIAGMLALNIGKIPF